MSLESAYLGLFSAAPATKELAATAWANALSPYTASFPSGVVAQYAGAAAPAGWLLCDGTSYLRATYPDLFTALGGTGSLWGLPDGTHFKVPDARGRGAIGVGTGSGLTARVLGTNYGAETHTHSVTSNVTIAAEAAHVHSVTSNVSANVPGHYHSTSATGATIATSASSGRSATHTHTITNGGYAFTGGSAHAAYAQGYFSASGYNSRDNVATSTMSIAAETADHTHTIAHAAFSGTVGLTTGGSDGDAAFAATVTNNAVNSGTVSHTHTVTNNAVTSGSSSDNCLQPSVGFNFIIKT